MDATERRELAFTPAVEQARLVRRGAVSPSELAECYLARIDELNPRLGAYLTVAEAFAREHARRAEDVLARGEDVPPLCGVPLSVKDLNDTAGIRTTHGTAAWADRVPEADDEVVSRMKAAGLVVLGKTVTPEFGPLNISEPPAYPPGRNPWDPERSCGGSSGGAAAALAAGLCALSHGSDGGGSIRNPAAWCGVYGIKPTRGRVSDRPRPNRFFSINGPLGRTVADAAALLDAMAGYATGDAWWAPPPERPLLEEVGVPPGRLRVAVHPHPGLPAGEVAPAHRTAAEEAAALLGDLGHVVEPVDPPVFDPELLAGTSVVFAADWAARVPELPPLETMDPWMRTLIEMGNMVRAPDYVAAMHALQDRSRQVVGFFDRFDLLLTPTVAQPPPRVGEYRDVRVDQVARMFALTPFTAMWNTTGQPAVSIPWGLDDDGLPVGVQLVGRPAAEATLVRVSAQVEEARPWAGLRPPVS